MFFDLSLEELENYRPPRTEQADFDEFWKSTLAEARRLPISPRFEPVDTGLSTVEVFDVSYCGFGGQRIKAWFLLPKHRGREKLPCIVQYLGYGWGRGYPIDWLLWPSMGYAFLVMDTRGQGSDWRFKGDTPDMVAVGIDPHVSGFLTMGILDQGTYYYRRVFTDAVRAVEAARSHPAVDTSRIAVTGSSQGGGITLAVGGLEETVSAVLPEVPFLCHYKRAIEVTDLRPYAEIRQYLSVHRENIDRVFRTLSYFDGVNFAARTRAPGFFAVALMDTMCPPSTIFAAYNHYVGQKSIRIYPYNNHEGGQSFHANEKMRFLSELWKN